MGFFSKIKNNLGGGREDLIPVASSPSVPFNTLPDKRSIYRNRQNFGVNFGSLFVQESYIFGKFFIDNTGNEFDAINAYIRASGIEKTKKELEDHWNGYVSDDDWKWLKEKGITAVRLPVGYWHVAGGKFTSGTPYQKLASVYTGSWNAIVEVVNKAKNHDIGVLIDLHALPGGANTSSDHSGIICATAEFWNESKYQQLVITILKFITQDLKDYENFIGLQLVNESEFSSDAVKQKGFYSKAILAIREIDANLPIIISDGWWPDQWVKWLSESEANLKSFSGVVIDSHIYRCFDDLDKNKSPEQIINDLESTVLTNLSGQADFVIGEYSCVIDGKSWEKTSGDRGALVRQYGQKQTSLYIERASFGYFFWTFKFQWGDGGEWGFVPSLNSGALLSQPTQSKIEPNDDDLRDHLRNAFSCHENYWKEQNPNENYEHWRFEDGFSIAWKDSVEFSKFNGSKLGRLHAWKSSRRQEHIDTKGDSRFIWEWDEGFDQGLQASKNFVFHSP